MLWLTGSVAIAGHFYPDYSHIAQFISELGATGSPYGFYLNYLGFIPTELFMLGFVVVSYSALPRTKLNIIGLIFITVYVVSLCAAAFFPCDFECRPDKPTLSHIVHMAITLPGYICGILAVVCISSGSHSWSKSNLLKVVGYTASVLAVIAFFNLNPSSEIVGLIQRLFELTLYSWFIFMGYCLSKKAQMN
ncbi:DUF998 domain-containing protein [Veronia nyctiphanis]|uniref:DUF998 domain-containing protein n=1 Tax=Veronia nyctiphanis TaxID=1278244 RepID=UPI0022A89CF3|nr:DUF998 domain-containing protein [Veronia nyctiphanis]